MQRLSRESLARSRTADVQGPPDGWAGQRVGLVHLGIGAFHRAHQAVFTQDAFAVTGDDRWGICGVTQRSADVQAQLRPQDGLYGVLERGAGGAALAVVGSVREVVYPGAEPGVLAARLASPAVSVVTVTVTEKGYRRTGAGRLDLADPTVAADLRGGEPVSAVGRLVGGLAARAQAGGGPLTVVCCDNLTDNGRVLHGLVLDYCAAAGADDLAGWVEANVTFPATMVDRIVPATTATDRALGERLLGLRDEGLVTAEPFRQWVIEDRFAAQRPAWDLAGAQLVADVAPFERMKLAILNGTHSTLAYLGALRGHRTITAAMADPGLAELAGRLIEEDVIPVLEPPPGTELADYGQAVLDRFANPALAHRTTQVAMDGSQKLPQRLLATVRANRARGRIAEHALRGVAGWMAYLACPTGAAGLDLPVQDPLADRLTGLVRGVGDPALVVARLLELPEVFGTDLPGDQTVRDLLVEAVSELLTTADAP